mmetsp:Transcript_9365/g.25442  ORF Transcript_9365/g.25442 Transcript_9365/m.25442 type:complete len:335 (-) Transcript_9365:252-1256(-)|eukprot:CAMPEP_0198120380 /NCGR_PEP_ID=MMETSP1442-20131203/28837_1 /TAXON_ID= /ORGANISM="Craspedostauros australis, Strain CCMP3328" /LENGTH=334 /DNA_ID=CAMNT_0043779027 /DNA_START=192 /DNA_END=1196 /DNA_ORIENTATION=-
MLKCLVPIGSWTVEGQSDYIHPLFFVHLLAQVINATIQHKDEQLYLTYIILLHGPILLVAMAINQMAHVLMAKRVGATLSPIVLFPSGGDTVHTTTSLSDEVKVAATGPISHAIQAVFWLLLYIIFSGAAFDETLTDGVTTMDSFNTLLQNLCAQAMYININIMAINLIDSAFPSDAASLVAAALITCFPSSSLRSVAFLTDIWGSLMCIILTVVGIRETFWDDGNGIGVFHLCVFPVLLLQCIRRLWSLKNGEGAINHPVVGRKCFQQKEDDVNKPYDYNETSMRSVKQQEKDRRRDSEDYNHAGGNNGGDDADDQTEDGEAGDERVKNIELV